MKKSSIILLILLAIGTTKLWLMVKPVPPPPKIAVFILKEINHNSTVYQWTCADSSKERLIWILNNPNGLMAYCEKKGE